jgi:hypothetical protein
MIRKLIPAALAAISVASAANASTITYSLIPGPGGAGTFALTAATSIGDNFGLVNYSVELQGATTIQHVNVSPRGFDVDSGFSYGFPFLRSADNAPVVSAAQDFTGAGFAVYGMGQTAGTLKSLVPASDTFGGGRPDANGTYGAPIVLATGTWVGHPPTIVPGATGFVFTSKGTGGAFGQIDRPTSIVIHSGGCLDCVRIVDATIDNVDPNDPGMVMTTLTASPDSLVPGPYYWSFPYGFSHYQPAPGASRTGAAVQPTIDPITGKFSWNTVGSPLGIYTWGVSAENVLGNGLGFVTLTLVPEPATFALIGLAFSCAVFRRRS